MSSFLPFACCQLIHFNLFIIVALFGCPVKSFCYGLYQLIVFLDQNVPSASSIKCVVFVFVNFVFLHTLYPSHDVFRLAQNGSTVHFYFGVYHVLFDVYDVAVRNLSKSVNHF